MTRFTLAAPEEWILKVVQAAVIAQSQGLELRIRRDSIQIDVFSECDWEWDDISTQILDPNFSGESSWKELFTGLRSILSTHSYLLTNSQGQWVSWHGQGFEVGDEDRALPGGACLRVMARKKSESLVDYAKDQVARAREVAAYQSVLEERASYAPLKLSLGGRVLTTRDRVAFQDTILRESTERRGALALLWAQIRADKNVCLSKAPWRPLKDRLLSRSYFLTTPPGLNRSDDRYFSLRYNFEDRPQGQTEEGSVKLWERTSLEGRFQVQYTRWGVVCARKSFLSALEGELVVPADHEQTDLTGLSIETDSILLNSTQRSLGELTSLALSLLQELESHKAVENVEFPRWKDIWGFAGGIGGGFTVSAFFHGLAFATALKGGLIIGGLTLPFISTTQRLDSEKRALLMKQVRDFLPQMKTPISQWRPDELSV